MILCLRRFFQTLDICHLNHEVDQDVTFHGRWEVGLNAGGVQKADFRNYSKNPQCFVRLNDPDPSDPEGRCSAIISLMQRREPKSRAKGLNKVCFDAIILVEGHLNDTIGEMLR